MFGEAQIVDNVISYNSSGNGAGINIANPGAFDDTVFIEKNVISDTIASNVGGGLNCNGFAIINNNTISNNTASTGGGIQIHLDELIVSNNMIVNNTATGNWTSAGDEGLFCEGSCPVFKNSIFLGNIANNSGQQVFLYNEASDPDFYYCDIEGGSAAFELNGNFYIGNYSNNIDSDPLFVAPSAGSGTEYNGMTADWSLQPGSPCIDAGNPAGSYPPYDIAGNPRVQNGIIDTGAYESPGTTGLSIIDDESPFSIYPNPSDGEFTLKVEIANIYKIEIYNSFGTCVKVMSKLDGSTYTKVGISSYPAGVYFMKVYDGIKNYSRKIVLQ